MLPYGRQVIEDDDIAAVVDVLQSDWLTTGPSVAAFEEALAERVGAEFAVCCANGTAALHLAAAAIGLGPGDVAVVPSLTFAATANAARFVGAEVVFADVDAETGLLTGETLCEALDRALGRNLKAVFPVHLNGQCADPDGIADVARDGGLRIVEDACHALGSVYPAGDGSACRVGECRHADVAVFSFHPVKTIAAGEGGAITTNDRALYDRLRHIRSHCLTKDPTRFENEHLAFGQDGAPNPWYYEITDLGFNYRLSDLNCALALSQLRKIDRFIERRQSLVARYDRNLSDLAPTVRPVRREPGMAPAWHLYPVLIDFDRLTVDRGELMRRLLDRGVGTQVHYIPLHLQPYYRREVGTPRRLEGAEAYYRKVLSLPLFPALEDADNDLVVQVLHEVIDEARA